VLAEEIAKAEDDPLADAIAAVTAAAPPPGDWDPETTRAVRRLLREDR
jgi:hypothetical protein